MLLSKKGTCDAPPSARCPMAAAESFKADYNIAELARSMGANPAVLRSKLDDACDTHILGFREVIAITHLTRDHRCLQAWAFSLGKALISLPDPAGLSDDELSDQILSLQIAVGDFAKELKTARDDGMITKDDFKKVQASIRKILEVTLQLNAELEQTVRDTPPTPPTRTALRAA